MELRNGSSTTERVDDLKEGVLLEVGFDDVTPNEAKDISSWAYDYAAGKIDVIDNRAKGVACYDSRYTFVEKLQTISTKFRLQQKSGESEHHSDRQTNIVQRGKTRPVSAKRNRSLDPPLPNFGY